MTQFPELFAALAAPFDADEVKSFSVKGRALRYVNAWTVMNRLDEVFGAESWTASFVARESSVECTLSIRLPDGSTLQKINAGGYSGMEDEGDDDMSGYSNSFKRAAASLGVARYLYGSRGPRFGPPTTQAPAPPAPEPRYVGQPAESDGHANGHANGYGHANGNGHANGHGRSHDGPPRTGRELYAWLKDRGEESGHDLIGYVNKWSRLQEDFPVRIVACDPEQVALVVAEATRKLSQVRAAR